MEKANLIHCTSDFEVEWNRRLGLKRTFLAPLGTFLPETEVEELGGQRNDKVLLFVGRIYPVKALDRLIEAFARAFCQLPTTNRWALRLVGPDQAGHMAELMSLCEKLGLTSVQFAGPRFGKDLENEYGACDALALVSHTENFGATVVDALAHGKPVITSTRTPWKIVADSRCGWWVDNDVETLSNALSELMALDDETRSEKGRHGRLLVEERYTWTAVCDKMLRGYEEVLR